MKAGAFIAHRLRFKGKMAVVAIAVSFFVIIIAVSVASGFRDEMGKGLADLSGDITVTAGSMNFINEQNPVHSDAPEFQLISGMEEVSLIRPAVYRYGIVKSGDCIQGVLVKGVKSESETSLGVKIPRKLAQILELKVGDELPTYFVGEKVQVRKFKVEGLYDALMDSPDKLVVMARLEDMQRLFGWKEGESSSLEIVMKPEFRNPKVTGALSEYIADSTELMSRTIYETYGSLFEWLNLIDANVLAILILMVVVAGFNMISGLLILLFRSVSTIGILKAMGMTDMKVSAAFLRISARAVALGMLAGNALALLVCLIQNETRVLKLDPANYFVSFVPMHPDVTAILAVDAISFAAILVLLLIPTLFISKVDPARTVRAR